MSEKNPPDDKVVDLNSFKKREGKTNSTNDRKNKSFSPPQGPFTSNRGYFPGQNVTCEIVSKEKDGYYCMVDGSHPAYLSTEQELNPGKELLCQVVCLDRDLILLTDRFDGNDGTGTGNVRNLFYNSKDDSEEGEEEPDAASSDNCIPFKHPDKDE